jgi:hypothetical protein
MMNLVSMNAVRITPMWTRIITIPILAMTDMTITVVLGATAIVGIGTKRHTEAHIRLKNDLCHGLTANMAYSHMLITTFMSIRHTGVATRWITYVPLKRIRIGSRKSRAKKWEMRLAARCHPPRKDKRERFLQDNPTTSCATSDIINSRIRSRGRFPRHPVISLLEFIVPQTRNTSSVSLSCHLILPYVAVFNFLAIICNKQMLHERMLHKRHSVRLEHYQFQKGRGVCGVRLMM